MQPSRVSALTRSLIMVCTLFLFFSSQNIIAQTGRGTIISKNKTNTGVTRAVVVGVSEYLNLPENRQLSYADDDAMLFYALLKRLYPANEQENLKLIVNAEANAARIKETVSSLIDESVDGDRLIIYFAGHGDVFSDSAKKIDDAFLLCHGVTTDADYSISDAISMHDLHSLIASGLQNNVSVLLITDACRSGKYATSETGAFATARVLSEKWDKIARIASCQANELSYEDPQWGGGHGAFTWFLIDGMAGAADEMGDSLIDFSELEFYVKRSVRIATTKKQNPVFLGDANTGIAAVSGATFDRSVNMQSLLASRASGDIPYSTDSTVNSIIRNFMSCLKKNRLLEPADSCAWFHYQKLLASAADRSTVRKARGSLFIALDQSAQKILDIYLSGSGNMPPAAAFEKAARETEVARGLFISKKALTKKMMPKQLFLEAWAIIRAENRPEYALAEKKLKRSVKLDKKASYSYNALGKLYLLNEQYGAAEYNLKKAIERAPRWTYPRSNLGLVYSERHMWSASERVFSALVCSDSNFSWGYNNLGCLHFDQGKYENCRQLWQKASQLQPGDPVPLMNLGTLAKEQGRMADAASFYKKARRTDTLYAEVNVKLGDYYSTFSDSLTIAEYYYRKAIELEPFFAEYYNALGRFYKGSDVRSAACRSSEMLFKKAIELDPYDENAYYNLSDYYLMTGDTSASEKTMRTGVKKCRASARSMYLMGINAWNRRQYGEAEKALLTSIQNDPLYLNSYLKLGEFYEQRSRGSEAEKLYRDAVRIFDDSPLLCYDLANYFFRRNLQDSAARWYRNSLAEDSLYSYGWSSLAYLYLKQDEFALATVHFLKAQQLNPYKHKTSEFAYLLRNRADSTAAASIATNDANATAKAMAAYKAALVLEPFNATTRLALARLCYLTSDAASAESHIGYLLALPDMPLQQREAVEALQARVLLDVARPADALSLCELLIGRDPFPSYLNKALALYMLGRTDEALNFFRLEKTENPQFLEATWLKTTYSPMAVKLINELAAQIIK